MDGTYYAARLQVNGGSQSFNTVNVLRVLGRWMRMITIPNQSSVPMAWTQFEEDGRMKVRPLWRRLHRPALDNKSITSCESILF